VKSDDEDKIAFIVSAYIVAILVLMSIHDWTYIKEALS